MVRNLCRKSLAFARFFNSLILQVAYHKRNCVYMVKSIVRGEKYVTNSKQY